MGYKERLEKLLEIRGWSLRMLAARSGISRSNLSAFFSSKARDMSFSNMIKITDALGVSLDWLAGRDRGATPDLPPDEAQLLQAYRRIARPGSRMALISVAEEMAAETG